MKKMFLLPLFSLLFAKAIAQNNLPPVYEIKADTAYIKVPDSCWQMLEDGDGKWTISQVSQSPLNEKFHPNTDIDKSSAYIHWVRFMLKNNMDHEGKLLFTGYTPFFDLYTKQDNSLWEHRKTGWLLPWSEKDGIKNNNHILMNIKSGQELLVYQRLKFEPALNRHKSLSVGFGFTEQFIRNSYVLDETTYLNNIRMGIVFGICMLAAIFSFFFSRVARERVYLHAAMAYFSIALLYFTPGLFSFFFHENPKIAWDHGQVFLIVVFLYSVISTVRISLETKRQTPRWDKFLAILSGSPLLWAVAQYIFPVVSTWDVFMAILIFLSVIITCLVLMRNKNKSAQLFKGVVLFTIVYLLLTTLAMIMKIQLPGWLEKHDLDIQLLYTSLLIIISFWMLFERYRQLQKKVLQDAFEKEQMAKEKEIERRQLIEQQKLELEKQVTERTAELKQSLEELKSTQAQLIQSEKMASLGELTAGIAHEIQNPLNFVNNFSEVSTELVNEMNEEINKGNLDDAKEIANDLKQNLEKINHHGKRAGDIVRGMLQHSRSISGSKEPTDINAIADEYLRLSYHGLRAKDKSFNATIKTDFDERIGKVNIIPQDIGRVLLNLYNNAFYAVNEKKQNALEYEPTVLVATKKIGDKLEIKVADNGNGIPQKIQDKIFHPFFTTKPTGQGTGLGLSLSYDIVKAHGGELKVETKEGERTELIIHLPIV